MIKVTDKEKVATIISPLLAVILGLLFGFIILTISGYDAVEGFKYLYLGAARGLTSGNLKPFGNTLAEMTPLLLTGASVAFAFKTGLFNIGAPGQFLMGGFAAVLLGVLLDLPPVIFPIVCLLAAAAFGAMWGFIPGFLKAKFGINEVVICIMLNYTAMWLVTLMCKTFIPDPTYATESAKISKVASLRFAPLTKFTDGSYISMAFFIGILVLIAMYIILEKTTFGFELKAVGYNKDASNYAGIKVNRNIIYSMLISGAMAGLAGSAYYIGYTNHIKYGEILSYGFDGIAVSLLGLNSPIGVFLSSLLFGFLKNGASYMEGNTSIPREIISIVISSIIYFSAISLVFKNFIMKFLEEKKEEGDK